MLKRNIEVGEYLGKYRYAKMIGTEGDSAKFAVVFPPSNDLLKSISFSEKQIGKYRRMIPQKYSLLIISYNEDLTEDHLSNTILKDIDQIIRENTKNNPIIIGISYGGKLAIKFAADFPEITDKLILLISAHELSYEGVKFCNECIEYANKGDRYLLGIQFSRLYTKTLYQLIVNIYLFLRLKLFGWISQNDVNPLSTLINAYKYIVEHNLETKLYLTRIQTKTLVLGGDSDLLFTKEIYNETADLIPNGNGSVRVFPNAGHMMPIEQPELCRFEIENFLRD